MTVTAGEPDLAEPAPDEPGRFGEWVRPHLARMANLVARLAPGTDRDDVVQEALARAWAKRRQFDATRGTAANWLLAITADQAAKAKRRARPTTPLDAGHDRAVDATSDRTVDVERALTRLTARQRLAIECVYFVDLTVAQTATVMRCSEGTVKSTLADARARLRQLLEVSP